MLDLLRNSSQSCRQSSIQTYHWNIISLAKLAGLQEVPGDSGWIDAALLETVRSLPNITRAKNFSVAAIKALRAYGQHESIIEPWVEITKHLSDMYSKQRDSQQRTDRERANWPDAGYQALSDLARELRHEIRHIFEKSPGSISNSELWQMGRWFLIKFYSKHALRGDLADVEITKGPKSLNYLYKDQTQWCIFVSDHKTSASHGPIDLALHPEVTQALDVYLPFVEASTDHGFLFSTKRFAHKMNRRDMLLILRNTTEDRLGKRLGTQLIRVLKTTEFRESLDRARELRQELAHGAATQWQYVSR